MLFEGIRKKLGVYALKKELKQLKRSPGVFGLSSANSVGIIFHCTDETILNLVGKLIKRLREDDGVFKIQAIAYSNEKEIPEFLQNAKHVSIFHVKDLAKNLFPQGDQVSAFLKEEFDLLIDLNLNECFPNKVLAARANAKMKIGKDLSGKEEVLDMLIDMKDSESMPELIEQVIHFLKMLDKSTLRHG